MAVKKNLSDRSVDCWMFTPPKTQNCGLEKVAPALNTVMFGVCSMCTYVLLIGKYMV